jgi:hypothetical protein
MSATRWPRAGRIVVLALAAAAVAGTALTGPSGQAATVKPLPKPLTGYELAKTFTGADIAGPAWNAPMNNPGGCLPNPAAISLTKSGAASMATTGEAGDCVQAESPHTYPTAPGYVYEASVYDSSFRDWGGYWSYGSNWPDGGELDVVESLRGASYVSYHYTGNATVSTVPWHQALKAAGKDITTGWHIVDVAYFAQKIEIFYDGQLYVTIAGKYITTTPAWIVFGDGSCQSATYNVCASDSDIGVKGNFEVKWMRIFKR